MSAFKHLDTFVDIQPFLFDLNIGNNAQAYSKLIQIKKDLNEKYDQQKLDMIMLEIESTIN